MKIAELADRLGLYPVHALHELEYEARVFKKRPMYIVKEIHAKIVFYRGECEVDYYGRIGTGIYPEAMEEFETEIKGKAKEKGDCIVEYRIEYLEFEAKDTVKVKHDDFLKFVEFLVKELDKICLLYTSPSPRDS